MEIPKSEMEIFEFVQKEHEAVLKLHKDLNHDYISHLKDNISQKRDFYKNLIMLCGIILGFMPSFLNSDNIKEKTLFFVSMVLFLSVIIIVVNYLRTVMDVEGNELKKQLDKYNSILNSQIEIRRKFMNEGIFTQESLRNLLIEMNDISKAGIENIKMADNESKNQARNERIDYAGEFFVYLFVLGILFLILSFFERKFSVINIISVALLLSVPVFFFPVNLFIYLGYPIQLIKNFIKNKFVIINKE